MGWEILLGDFLLGGGNLANNFDHSKGAGEFSERVSIE